MVSRYVECSTVARQLLSARQSGRSGADDRHAFAGFSLAQDLETMRAYCGRAPNAAEFARHVEAVAAG